jgi:hypothetical protein
MGTRGRTSTASLAVAGPLQLEIFRRPEPPKELHPPEAAEWRAIVASLPPDWFTRETHALLVQYCRLIVQSRNTADMIVKQIKKMNSDPTKDHFSLLERMNKMQERDTRNISSLASRMRLSQQSKYRREKVHKRVEEDKTQLHDS